MTEGITRVYARSKKRGLWAWLLRLLGLGGWHEIEVTGMKLYYVMDEEGGRWVAEEPQ